MKNVKELLKERKTRVEKTLKREKADKVPNLGVYNSWGTYYAGIKNTDVKTLEQAKKINQKIFDELQFDCVELTYMPAHLLHAPRLELAGGGSHVVGEDTTLQANTQNLKILDSSEYPELIRDPFNYLLDEVFPRRFKVLKKDMNSEEKKDRILKMLDTFKVLGEYNQTIEDNGVCNMWLAKSYNPVDYILDYFRDFTGTMMDIKRCPELLRDAGMALMEVCKANIASYEPSATKTILVPMHLPPYLRPKDFEKVYWPSFKAMTDYFVDKGYILQIWFEKNYSHLYDYLQELPKQNILGIFEEDDLRVVKKKLGNTMSIGGGMPTNLLNYGSKQECLDYAKSLLDDLAPGGGYFFSTDKPLLYSSDANPENYRAVSKFVNEYGIYK